MGLYGTMNAFLFVARFNEVLGMSNKPLVVVTGVVLSALVLTGCALVASNDQVSPPGSEAVVATADAATADATAPATLHALKSIAVSYGSSGVSANYEIKHASDGKLESITASSSGSVSPKSYTFSYDGSGKLASYVQEAPGSDSVTTTLSYDGSGNVTSEQLCSYETYNSTYQYDGDNLAAYTSNVDNNEVAVQYTYGTNGALESFVRAESGQEITTAYTYDSTNRLEQQRSDSIIEGSASHLYTANYEYNSDGYISAITYDAGGTWAMYAMTYEYDSAGHLVKAVADGGDMGTYTTVFTYDDDGCILSVETMRKQNGSSSLDTRYEFAYESLDAMSGPELSVSANYAPQFSMNVIAPVNINLDIPGLSDPTLFEVNSGLAL